MRHALKILALVVAGSVFANGANAACYADYKAKRGDPLRLHYGVIEISDAACADPDLATAEVAQRIASSSWQLLNVLTTFDETGLGDRKKSAGKFFLRF